MTLKMEICENHVIICIYTNVIVMKMKINRHLWEVTVMARAGPVVRRPQHDSSHFRPSSLLLDLRS